MHSPNSFKLKNTGIQKRLLNKTSLRYYASAKPVKDLRSLTLEDFKPPIALKSEFPKLKRTKHLVAASIIRRTKHLGELFVTGKYACIRNHYLPTIRNNIGLDTTDIFFESSP